jgi:MFS family permease
MVVLVLRVTGSSAAPAGYMLARVLPRILGASPGGALADRFTGARVVAVCSVFQGLLTVGIISAGRAGVAWAIFTAVAVGQLLNGVSKAAFGAILPTIVTAARIPRANALYQIVSASSLVVAPALGAPLLVLSGPELLLAIDAVSFLGAAILMLTLPLRSTSRTANPLEGATVGLRLVLADPALRALAAAYLAESIAVTVAGSVLVLAAADRLGGTSVVGLLYAAVGVGDLIGGAVALRLRPRIGGRLVTVTFALLGILGVALFTITHSLVLAMLPLLLNGIGETSYITYGAIDMQTRVSVRLLGRVNAVFVSAQFTGMILGAVLALILVPLTSWPTALFTACCAAIAILAVGVIGLPYRRPTAQAQALQQSGGPP